MAMVDAMPVPDSRQKVDELFLFWLSESSTQELLRSELSKVCRYGGSGEDGGESPSILESLVQQPTLSAGGYARSGSPANSYRTPSPPLHLSNSPKSPRAKRRAKSPRRNLKYGLLAGGSGGGSPSSPAAERSAVNGPSAPVFDDVDYFPSALAGSSLPTGGLEGSRKTEKAAGTRAHSKADTKTSKEAARAGKVKTRQTRRASSEVIPLFFFPNGRQGSVGEGVEEQLRAAEEVFREKAASGEVAMEDFHLVVKAMKLPLYWKAPLFRACVEPGNSSDEAAAMVSLPGLRNTWERVTKHCHDNPARFVQLLAAEGRSHLTESDFEPLIQDVVDTHPGLAFLSTAPEFHARYVETVSETTSLPFPSLHNACGV
jgi:serine/threonine-protein phosphatase 2A regulatory subunit B''